ncbi:MAG: aminotransferase class V-fold PLP-dependent enzyme, partial [Oscillospiraceae bacterium]|nr:aminotransferase class V-fold PLP-dependent enzyme [Oscillospiraceae bacterium]
MIYFDNSATTVCSPEAARAAVRYMTETYYNPAAAYAPAVRLERDVQEARSFIASRLKADPAELTFTSCGTESNNTALFGSLAALPSNLRGRGRIIISAVEHPSVYEAAMELRERGYDV